MTMDLWAWRNLLETLAEWTFSRSSGAGGQNVNKVNTKAQLRVALAALAEQPTVGPLVVDKLRQRLAARVADEALTVAVQDRRTQWENRELALDRLASLILGALKPVKHRRATKPTRSSQETRLETKQHRSRTKTDRQNRSWD